MKKNWIIIIAIVIGIGIAVYFYFSKKMPNEFLLKGIDETYAVRYYKEGGLYYQVYVIYEDDGSFADDILVPKEISKMSYELAYAEYLIQ